VFFLSFILVFSTNSSVYATTTFVDALDVSGETIAPNGIAFNSDGTIMLIADLDGEQILEYTCSSGFDVSTCSNTGTDDLDLSLILDSELTDLEFNSAGTIMLLVDSDSLTDEIKEYTCSSGFDVSTCTTTGTDDLDINGDLSNVATGLAFNSAGTIMLVVDDGGDILEYTCSSGFDVSTCTTTGTDDLDVSGQADPTGMAFNSDGTKMFVIDDTDGEVNEYTLSVGFDVSTASFVNAFDFGTPLEDTPTGVAFSSNGLTMLITGDGDGGDVSEYTLEVAFDLFSSPATTSSSGSGGGGSDNRHKTKPSFGLDHNTFLPLVESGFSFNGISQDITDNFWTPFEEQEVKIGKTNTFAAKVFADKQLRVQEFLFGIPTVGDAHKAELGIEVIYDYSGEIEKVKVIQKTDIVDDSIQVIASKSKCFSDDPVEKCVTTLLSMKFLEPLRDKVMAIKAIDFKGRTQITYLNEGFDISGNSLNPMQTMMIPGTEKYEGLIKVTQTEKYSDIWISEDGRKFKINEYGSSKQTNQSFERHIDTGVLKNRNHSEFLEYKQDQIDRSQIILEELCEHCTDVPYGEINDIFFYNYPIVLNNLDSPEIQSKMIFESERAQNMMDIILDPSLHAK
jgi:hypothetical protein